MVAAVRRLAVVPRAVQRVDRAAAVTEDADPQAAPFFRDLALGGDVRPAVDHDPRRIPDRRRRPKRRSAARRLAALACLAALAGGCAGRRDERITLFAAASLGGALDGVVRLWEEGGGVPIDTSYAGSNVLARQIEAAPAADLFISADERWMDRLDDAGRLVAGSRRPLLSNRLVVVARRDAPPALAAVTTAEALAAAPFRYVSLADPDAVPAGRYAAAWLRSAGVDGADLWSRLADRVVPAADVRAALELVRAEPEAVGIVYRTDLAVAPELVALFEPPASGVPPIRYVAAAVERPDPSPAARALLDFLASPAAREVFARAGFVPLADG